MSKKHKKGMKPVQVFLPEDLVEIAKERAGEFGMSLSEYLRSIIVAGVKYGLYVPGEELPTFKVRLSEEELEKITDAVKEALQEEKEKEKAKKGILRKLIEWFR